MKRTLLRENRPLLLMLIRSTHWREPHLRRARLGQIPHTQTHNPISNHPRTFRCVPLTERCSDHPVTPCHITGMFTSRTLRHHPVAPCDTTRSCSCVIGAPATSTCRLINRQTRRRRTRTRHAAVYEASVGGCEAVVAGEARSCIWRC